MRTSGNCQAALRRCRFNQRLTAKALALTHTNCAHALRRHDLLQAGVRDTLAH